MAGDFCGPGRHGCQQPCLNEHHRLLLTIFGPSAFPESASSYQFRSKSNQKKQKFFGSGCQPGMHGTRCGSITGVFQYEHHPHVERLARRRTRSQTLSCPLLSNRRHWRRISRFLFQSPAPRGFFLPGSFSKVAHPPTPSLTETCASFCVCEGDAVNHPHGEHVD